MTSPEPLAIDYVDSHARLRGDDVELVLCGPTPTETGSTVVLSRNGTTVSVPAEVTQSGVRARTRRSGLSDGQWSIALGAEVVDARLLVQGDRPLVLLLGAEAARSVVPKPRRVAPTPSLARRVARRLLR